MTKPTTVELTKKIGELEKELSKSRSARKLLDVHLASALLAELADICATRDPKKVTVDALIVAAEHRAEQADWKRSIDKMLGGTL